MNRNPFFLLTSKFSSDVAAFMSFVTFSGYIYFKTANSVMVGIFFTIRIVGILIGSIIAPRIYHCSISKRVIASVDFGRLIAIVPLHFLSEHLAIYYLLFVAFTLGFGQAVFNVGVNTKVPLLFNGSDLFNINSWIVSCGSFGTVGGSLLAGLLIGLIGYDGVFVVNTGFYLVSCLAFILICDNHVGNNNNNRYSFRSDFDQFMENIKIYPILGIMLIVALVDTLGSASHNVGFPILSSFIDAQNPNRIFGFILGTWAFGKFSGARVIKFLIKKYNNNLPFLFFVGVCLMSMSFIALFWQKILIIILLFALLAGIGDGIAEVTLISYAQTFEAKIRSFVLSTFIFIQMIGFSLGLIVCSFVFRALPPQFVVTIFHGIPLLTLLLLYFKKLRVKIC